MKPNDQSEAQRIVEHIEAGTASRSDVVALLMYLREDLKASDPVRDVADCVAHTTRDRGDAFKYIEKFVNGLVSAVKIGGIVNVDVLFPLEDLIEQLIKDLEAQHLTVQHDAFRQQFPFIRAQLGDIMDGVRFKLPNAHVVVCMFATASSRPNPLFIVMFQGLEKAEALPLYPDVPIGFPVFVDVRS